MDRERCPLGHQTQQGPGQFNTINYYPLLPEAQKKTNKQTNKKTFIHSNVFPPILKLTKQFACMKFVWRGVKGFFKVKKKEKKKKKAD